jgi:beta-glucosidase
VVGALFGGLPLYFTENGIGTAHDAQRISDIRTAISGVLDAVESRVEVRGYTYWSLLDNFE